MNKLELHVMGCMKAAAKQNDEQELQVAGFAWETLIPIMLPILTQMLTTCFNRPSTEELAGVLKQGMKNDKVRRAAFAAIQKATQNRVHAATQQRLSVGLCEACSTATDAQRIEFITGVKQAIADGMFI